MRRIHQLQADIGAIEIRLAHHLRENNVCKAVAEIPGVGLITATAIVANMGSPSAFNEGREFAAWIGMVRPGRQALAVTCDSSASASAEIHTCEPGGCKVSEQWGAPRISELALAGGTTKA